eukprot:scaffold92387_cov63-Phaeocystis_antarctica.AAC.4
MRLRQGRGLLHHEAPLRRVPPLPSVPPHCRHRPPRLLEIPLPGRAPGQRRREVAAQSVERPVGRRDMRVVVGTPGLARSLLAPAVHPVALGPALLARLRGGGRRRDRCIGRGLQRIRPVQHRGSDRVLLVLQEVGGVASAAEVLPCPERLVHVRLELLDLIGRWLTKLLDRHAQRRRGAALVRTTSHEDAHLVHQHAIVTLVGVVAKEGR